MRTRLAPFSFRFLILFSALTILLLLFARAMFKRLDHDEHQFIASAALLARRSLLPYRDYPHFHMPYLIVIYAMLLKLTDHLLLAARLFSTACGLMTVGIVAWITGRLFESRRANQRRMIVAAVVLILISNPLFLFTSGRSWNHDLPDRKSTRLNSSHRCISYA